MSWSGKRVVVLGLARQGKALARHLSQKGAQVVVSDLKDAQALQAERLELADLPIEYVLGGHPPSLLDRADLLCLSGGVPVSLPLAQQARQRGIRLTNDSQVFLEACPALSIGITGSAGKTTVTALAGRILEDHLRGTGRHAWVGGNIGRSPLADLERMTAEDVVVLELSSFQLELMTISPKVAALLNLTPNHLDRHVSMAAYTAAKVNILAFQEAADLAILGRDDPGAWALRDHARGRLLSFGLTGSFDGEGTYIEGDSIQLRRGGTEAHLCPVKGVALRGIHNLQNVAAACAIAGGLDIPAPTIESAIRSFRGVPHRLEFVRRVGEVDWYNDSIATAPERAIAAIRSFSEPIVLLAGGRDKDLPWDAFAELVCCRVDRLVLFGEAGPKIQAVIKRVAGCAHRIEPIVCAGLDEAVQAAARVARPGSVVLLAPGGTSFDQFADFEARGERFRALVNAL